MTHMGAAPTSCMSQVDFMRSARSTHHHVARMHSVARRFCGRHTDEHASEEQIFLAAYPAQPASANAQKCWNWFSPGDRSGIAESPH